MQFNLIVTEMWVLILIIYVITDTTVLEIWKYIYYFCRFTKTSYCFYASVLKEE